MYEDARCGRRLVEIALCNDRETPPTIPVNEWLFQTKLRVEADGAAVFLPVRDVLEQDWPEHDEEVRSLHLQYRDRLEFAVGYLDVNDVALPVGLLILKDEEGLAAWGTIMAGTLLVLAPMLLIFLIAQRYIVGGITQGALKG